MRCSPPPAGMRLTRAAASAPACSISKRSTAPVLCRARHSNTKDGALSLLLERAAAPALLAAALWLTPLAADAASSVYDGAKVIASERRDALARELDEFETSTGWRVRVFTSYGYSSPARAPPPAADAPTPRKLWGAPTMDTVVVGVDPSAPNILNVYLKLDRGWWSELQSRYGNLFEVREAGESASVVGAVGAIMQCLGAPDGCRVVPGLPQSQFTFTLVFSFAGGIVAGFVSKIPPQGMVRRRWVWLLLFSPLWASLFLSFGLGPVISRTDDRSYVAAECAAFATGLALLQLPHLLAPPPPLLDEDEGGGGGRPRPPPPPPPTSSPPPSPPPPGS